MRIIGVSLFAVLSAQAFGCVCEPNIIAAFNTIEKTILTDNVLIVNDRLAEYASSIDINTNNIKAETVEYKRLLSNEAALTLKLQEQLFLLKKMNDLQSNKNDALAIEIQAVVKQNESIKIIQAKELNKEMY